VTSLAQDLQLDEHTKSSTSLQSMMPKIVFLVRDAQFTFTTTMTEYLNDALTPRGTDPLRQQLCEMFPPEKRTILRVVSPLNGDAFDEAALRHIENAPVSALRPSFLKQMTETVNEVRRFSDLSSFSNGESMSLHVLAFISVSFLISPVFFVLSFF